MTLVLAPRESQKTAILGPSGQEKCPPEDPAGISANVLKR